MNTINPAEGFGTLGTLQMRGSVTKTYGYDDEYMFQFSFDNGHTLISYQTRTDRPDLLPDLIDWIDRKVLASESCALYEKFHNLFHDENASKYLADRMMELLDQLKREYGKGENEYHVVY